MMPLMTRSCQPGVEATDCAVTSVKQQGDDSYLVRISIGTSSQHTEIDVTLRSPPIVGTYTNANASAYAAMVDGTRHGPIDSYTWTNTRNGIVEAFPFTLVLTSVTSANGTYTVAGTFRTEAAPTIGTPGGDETIYVAF